MVDLGARKTWWRSVFVCQKMVKLSKQLNNFRANKSDLVAQKFQQLLSSEARKLLESCEQVMPGASGPALGLEALKGPAEEHLRGHAAAAGGAQGARQPRGGLSARRPGAARRAPCAVSRLGLRSLSATPCGARR